MPSAFETRSSSSSSLHFGSIPPAAQPTIQTQTWSNSSSSLHFRPTRQLTKHAPNQRTWSSSSSSLHFRSTLQSSHQALDKANESSSSSSLHFGSVPQAVIPSPFASTAGWTSTRNQAGKGTYKAPSLEYSDPKTPEHSSSEDSNQYIPPERPVAPPVIDEEGGSPLATTQEMTAYELYLANPSSWDTVMSELSTLAPESWITGTLIDMWLLDQCRRLYHQSSFRYIPTFFLHVGGNTTPDEAKDEISRFRHFFEDLPQDPSTVCPLENIIFVVCLRSVHFFTVAFTPNERRLHVIGMDWTKILRFQGRGKWDEWQGYEVLKKICLFFGWGQTYADRILVNNVSWPAENSYDCGPRATLIVEQILANALQLDDNGLFSIPNLQCCHPQRLSIARNTNHLAIRGYQLFVASLEAHSNQMTTYYGPLDLFDYQHKTMHKQVEEDINGVVRPIEVQLALAMRACHSCQHLYHQNLPPPSSHLDQDDGYLQEVKTYQLQMGTRNRADYVGEAEIMDTDSSEEESTGQNNFSDTPHQDSDNVGSDPSEIFRVEDWKQARIGRFPRPKHGPKLSPLKTLRGLRHPFSRTYDQYEGGPSLNELEPIHEHVLQLAQVSLVYIANKVITAPWTLYKDYGFRLLPDFMQMFHLSRPLLVRQHLCPVGLANPPGVFSDHQPTTMSRSGQPINTKDRTVLGARELLDLCDDLGHDLPLLNGKDKEEKFICVDLQRDRIIPTRVDTACDIDSVIWITRLPQLRGFMSFSAAPIIRDRPPVWKNNHVTIDLLYPQSEEDQHELGPRVEWQTKPFRLSRIPHLLLGQVDQTTIELIIFFPRMTHQHPHTKKWESSVPNYLQNLFWDRIFLPSVKKALSTVQASYVVLDREHANFKGAKILAHTFDNQELREVFQEMSKIIEENMEVLGQFGSFFFMFQLKGSKGRTQAENTQTQSSLENALTRFQLSYPHLDWNYMMNRKNGEILVDVGVTVQPVNKEPLVGLWRLDAMEASFGAAGFLSGDIHTINTLGLYGALQAEAPRHRSERTHIIFRSAYPLAYESVRQKDNSRGFFKAKEVYRLSTKYQKQLTGVHKIHRTKVQDQSYGVRDEYRVGGETLSQLVEFVDDMIEEFLESSPVLWLPTRTWFEFLDRRLNILTSTHVELYRLRPPNYGILSGLFAHLMQSVLFTPPMVDIYVREALAMLRYKNQVDSDGMFFLHTLDLSRQPMIEGLLQQDDRTVLALLGGPLPLHTSRPRRPDIQDGQQDENNYPLGRTPTWGEISQSLRLDPFQLMPRWSFPPALEHFTTDQETMERIASTLFIKLTQALWTVINPSLLSQKDFGESISSKITTIQEALKSWSVDFIHDNVISFELHPCNSGFQAVRGQRVATFRERRELYFVDQDMDEGKNLPPLWQVFLEETSFLGLYHQYLDKLNVEETLILHRCLGELFNSCQCLPDSFLKNRKGQMWTAKRGKIILLANPSMYRIETVGKLRKRGRGTERGTGAQRGLGDIKVQTLMLEGIDQEIAKRAIGHKTRAKVVASKKRLSVKKKKARVPPRRAQPKKTAILLTPSSGGERSNDDSGSIDQAMEDENSSNPDMDCETDEVDLDVDMEMHENEDTEMVDGNEDDEEEEESSDISKDVGGFSTSTTLGQMGDDEEEEEEGEV